MAAKPSRQNEALFVDVIMFDPTLLEQTGIRINVPYPKVDFDTYLVMIFGFETRLKSCVCFQIY
jgi:hypothetical protein